MAFRVSAVSAASVVTVAAATLFLPAACGCGGAVVDRNEPNDELAAATVLTPGVPVDGVLESDDADLFRCDVPVADTSGGESAQDGEGAGEAGTDTGGVGESAGDTAVPRRFVVTVTTDAPDDVELQVGASLPDSWEGITWPGWDPVAEGDRLEVSAGLGGGTVIMVLTGKPGTEYTVKIVWD